MAIKYQDIEFESVDDLLEYQRKTRVIETVADRPARVGRPRIVRTTPVIESNVKEMVQDPQVEKTITEFYEQNRVRRQLAHGKKRELADKLGVTYTRLHYLLHLLRQKGRLHKPRASGTKRAPNKYKYWTKQDDDQLLNVAKQHMGTDGKLEYAATTKIAKLTGRTRAAVSNRIFYLTKKLGKQ